MWKVIWCRKDLIFDCILLVYVTVTLLILVCRRQEQVETWVSVKSEMIYPSLCVCGIKHLK